MVQSRESTAQWKRKEQKTRLQILSGCRCAGIIYSSQG